MRQGHSISTCIYRFGAGFPRYSHYSRRLAAIRYLQTMCNLVSTGCIYFATDLPLNPEHWPYPNDVRDMLKRISERILINKDIYNTSKDNDDQRKKRKKLKLEGLTMSPLLMQEQEMITYKNAKNDYGNILETDEWISKFKALNHQITLKWP